VPNINGTGVVPYHEPTITRPLGRTRSNAVCNAAPLPLHSITTSKSVHFPSLHDGVVIVRLLVISLDDEDKGEPVALDVTDDTTVVRVTMVDDDDDSFLVDVVTVLLSFVVVVVLLDGNDMGTTAPPHTCNKWLLLVSAIRFATSVLLMVITISHSHH
jgi:hypothetical protein